MGRKKTEKQNMETEALNGLTEAVDTASEVFDAENTNSLPQKEPTRISSDVEALEMKNEEESHVKEKRKKAASRKKAAEKEKEAEHEEHPDKTPEEKLNELFEKGKKAGKLTTREL